MGISLRRFVSLLFWLGWVLVPQSVGAETTAPMGSLRVSADVAEEYSFRGWRYLVRRLREDGIPEAELRDIYLNPAMPELSRVPFALAPRESATMYRPVLEKRNVEEGRRFVKRHKLDFQAVEAEFHVNRYVIAAILAIETRFGANVGRHLVVNRLSRLAAVDEPENVLWNFRQHQKDDPTVTLEQVSARAAYLSETFYPEVPALFELARRNRQSLLKLKGSVAGAFGIPQFLPRSLLQFGVDGDGDSTISLFSESDAIWSVANFLAGAGWSDDAPLSRKRAALWRYNRSDPYIDAVLALARIIHE